MADIGQLPDFAISGEDRSIWSWWCAHPDPGLLVMEVKIGLRGPGNWPNPRSHRRLDAVHVPGYREPTFKMWDGDHAALAEAMTGRDVELVEAKWTLNLDVIGQCMAGVVMLSRTYPNHGRIIPVAVVRGELDPALKWVCDRRNIDVVSVQIDAGHGSDVPVNEA